LNAFCDVPEEEEEKDGLEKEEVVEVVEVSLVVFRVRTKT
jgi:hypothetical protein